MRCFISNVVFGSDCGTPGEGEPLDADDLAVVERDQQSNPPPAGQLLRVDGELPSLRLALPEVFEVVPGARQSCVVHWLLRGNFSRKYSLFARPDQLSAGLSVTEGSVSQTIAGSMVQPICRSVMSVR